MIIVDGHEDIAWNVLTFGRDYTRSAAETRQLEAGGSAPLHMGDTLLGWSDYQRGKVALVFSTIFAAPIRHKTGAWDILCYSNRGEARALYLKQMDVYRRLVEEHPSKFCVILTRSDLDELLSGWTDEIDGVDPGEECLNEEHTVGLVLAIEGGEGIRNVDELERWWQMGLRLIGPAWAGTVFCGGTREPGPLTEAGYRLLDQMGDLGFILDISHMDQQAALQALDHYPGRIVNTHGNVSALLKDNQSNRHLVDDVIRGLIDRNGVIGIVPYNKFLGVDWKRNDPRDEYSINQVVDHIDYVCQMAGDVCHVGLGSDFDGGFGLQAAPKEIDTIADLQKLIPLLRKKGYTDADIAAVLGMNWISVLQRALPENL